MMGVPATFSTLETRPMTTDATRPRSENKQTSI
jgi:hypothetical protein